MLRQVSELELEGLAALQVVEVDALEVADDDVFRELVVLEAVEVADGLAVGLGEVLAAAFVLHHELAGPVEVDVALAVVQLLHQLLEDGNAFAGDAEDVEEAIPEAFGIGILVVRIAPFVGEGGGAAADLVLGEWHGVKNTVWAATEFDVVKKEL